MSGRFVPLPQGLIGIAVGPLVRALFSYLTSWVADGAASLVGRLGHALLETSGPDLGTPLAALMTRTLAIGLALTLPLVLLAMLHGVVRRDLSQVVSALLVRVPLAVLLGAAALDVVRLAVSATDQMSGFLLESARGPVAGLFGSLADGLVGSGGVHGLLPGFGLVMLAGVAAAVAFLVWLELVVRAAAIEVATLFVPLALAGLVWPATAHWARRLAETLAALVMSKVVIVGVLALSAATLGSGSGVTAVVQGIALLALAAFAPAALLRLVPVVEAGSVSQLEGLAARARHAGTRAAVSIAAGLPEAGAAWDVADLLPSPAPSGVESVGFAASSFDPAAFSSGMTAELASLRGGEAADQPAEGQHVEGG